MSTTYQTHARIMRKVINHDSGGNRKIMCAWDTCDKDGYQQHSIRQHEHAHWLDCDDPLAKHVTFVFCTNRHKLFFLNCMGENARYGAAAGKQMWGNLPDGDRLSRG